MKTRFFFLIVLLAAFINQAYATVKSDLETASKNGNSVFLVVTDPNVTGTDKAMEIADKAKASAAKSIVIQMNRSDADNADIVAKYRLSGAPLPLILVIASNGVVTAGYTLAQATPELLVKAVPSPKKSEVLKSLSDGKSVFIVVTGKSMAEKTTIMNTCQQACIEMENNAKMIEISLDDPKENLFLTELKVNMTASEPMTYVVNPQGQITGTFTDNVNTNTLVASAKKVAASGCCPPGSGKSCGPTK
jgi:signal recognition particle receptor subunit beta